jgi:hypothetical protein
MAKKLHPKTKSKAVAPPRQPAKWKKHLKWGYLAVLTVLFLSNYTRTFDEKIDLNGDNIVYYATAQSIAQGYGIMNRTSFNPTLHNSQFQPGYPIFIAALMKCGFTSIHAVKVANGVLLYFSLVLLFFVLSAMCKIQIIAFTATAFAASHNAVLRLGTIMMSEILFLFLTLVVLFVLMHWDVAKAFTNPKQRWKDIVAVSVFAVCLGYAYLARSMGLSFVVAIILYFALISLQKFWQWIRARKKEEAMLQTERRRVFFRYAIMLGIAVISLLVPKTAWDNSNKRLGKTSNTTMTGFAMKENNQRITDFNGWVQRVANNAQLYIPGYIPITIFLHQMGYSWNPQQPFNPPAGKWVGGICILLVMLVALYRMPRGALSLFLYFGVYFGILFIFPEQYSGGRYMMPVAPFLIFMFLYGCYAAIDLLLVKLAKLKPTATYGNILSTVVCLVFVFCCQPVYAASIKTVEATSRIKVFNERNAAPAFVEYMEAAKWMKDNLPDTIRVACRKPEFFYIFSGGRKSGGIPWYATPEEVVAGFEKSNIDYVIIDHWFGHAYRTVVPAIQKYDNRFQVVHKIGGDDKQEKPATYVVKFFKKE